MDTGNVYMWSMIWELKWLLLLLFGVLAVYVIGKIRLQLRESFRDVIYDIRNSSIGVHLTLLPIITTLSYPQNFDGDPYGILVVYAWIIFIFIIYIFAAYKIGGSIADFGPPEKWTVVILSLFSAILTALPMEFVLSFYGDSLQVSYSTPALTMRDTFLGILDILFTVCAFFMFALPFVGRGIHNKASSVA